VKTAVETLAPTKVKLTVEVTAEDLKPAIAQAYKEISGQVNVPGFRKGHVPPRVIDRRFGRAMVLEEAVNHGLNDWYRAALDEHQVNPMDTPELEMTKGPEAADAEPSLEFTATVEIRPTIDLPDLATVTLEVEPATVTEQDVDQQLEHLRERFATLKAVDRPAVDGDYVTIDLKAQIGDEEIDSVSGVSYQVGSGQMLDGMDEALEGLSANEETTFETELAGGSHQGETALVTITPTAVKERELPEVTDEWVQEASEFDTIDELRADLTAKATQEKTRAQVYKAQDALIDHLLGTLDFEAPAGVVLKDADRRLEQVGKLDDDEARQEFLADSAKAVRTQLLMDALVEKLEVKANQGELLNFLFQTAQSFGMDAGQFIQTAEQTGELPHFYAELVRNKAAVKALRAAQVVDTDGQVVDIAKLLGPEETQDLGEDLAELDHDGDADRAVAQAGAIDEIEIDLDALELAEEDQDEDDEDDEDE
jgi:trigger factor